MSKEDAEVMDLVNGTGKPKIAADRIKTGKKPVAAVWRILPTAVQILVMVLGGLITLMYGIGVALPSVAGITVGIVLLIAAAIKLDRRGRSEGLW